MEAARTSAEPKEVVPDAPAVQDLPCQTTKCPASTRMSARGLAPVANSATTRGDPTSAYVTPATSSALTRAPVSVSVHLLQSPSCFSFKLAATALSSNYTCIS